MVQTAITENKKNDVQSSTENISLVQGNILTLIA
jgi:hypothetical protein